MSPPHDLTEHQKAKHAKYFRENLKILNDGGHCPISKFITVDEMYVFVHAVFAHEMYVFEQQVSKHQESNVESPKMTPNQQ